MTEALYTNADRILKGLLMNYKLVCRNCNSEDVVYHVTEAYDYGGDTGVCCGTLTVGCNQCKANDRRIEV